MKTGISDYLYISDIVIKTIRACKRAIFGIFENGALGMTDEFFLCAA